MSDLERAVRCVATYGHAVAAVKDGILLGTEDGAGVAPFVRLADRLGERLRGASVADRVIGRAVALACIHLGVAAVHAVLASQGAVAALDQAGVCWTADTVVPFVANRVRTGPCPTEELVREVADPAEALPLLQRFVAR